MNFIRKNRENITRDNNVIRINKLDHPLCVNEFLYCLFDGAERGYKDFRIFSHATAIFPNACVPIAGIIEYYKKKKEIDFNFDFNSKDYLHTCGFDIGGYYYDKDTYYQNLFDKIFYYNSSQQVADLTQSYIDYLSKIEICAEGVLDGLTWCINEVLDNVLIHSNADCGFIMAQYHPQTKHIAVCVYDYGIGIYNSLKSSKHQPKTNSDAISLAIQEGVGDGQGQGNGLYGLYEIIQNNNGSLTITSGNASLMFGNNELKKNDNNKFLSYDNLATIIDFQLDLSSEIDIKKAFKNIGEYDGWDARIDDMLNADDIIEYDIFNNCQGTATRKAGELLRKDICNIFSRSKSIMHLDFSNVKSVSSSFIDELIAKMVLNYGFVKFNTYFKLINMNPTVEFLCNRSVYMRVHESWSNTK